MPITDSPQRNIASQNTTHAAGTRNESPYTAAKCCVNRDNTGSRHESEIGGEQCSR